MVAANDADTSDREIILTRMFDAPRERVFDAWTDPAGISRWWGPRGFSTTTRAMDLRPGGVWRFTMHGPDGTDYENQIVYDEIARPDRLAYKHTGLGDHDDVRFRTTVVFADRDGRTELTMRMVFPTPEERNFVVEKYGAVEGGRQTLERLGEHLADRPEADREIVSARSFAAPREQVFAAFADSHRLARWWGPKGFTNTIEEFDLRPGGRWRLTMHGPDGADYRNESVFVEVAAPERIVFRHEEPIHRFAMTMEFDERDGGTVLTWRMLFDEAEECARVWSFVAAANEQNFDRLAVVLAGEFVDADLVVTRVFDAPPERVFDAWLDPAGLGRWLFATPGGEMVHVEADPRVGGAFTVVERRGDALAEHFGRYVEIDRPRRLAFEFSTDREANPTLVTVEFAPHPRGCELTLSHRLDPQWAAYADRARHGWTMILEGLAATVANRVLVLSRLFDAPREVVFRAWTNPRRLARWWGPKGFTNPVCEFDPRPGGAIYVDMTAPDGTVYPMKGTVREVAEPDRLVFVSSALDDEAGIPALEVLNTVTFADENGRTRLTLRAALLRGTSDAAESLAGMEQGWGESLDRLADETAARREGGTH